MNYRNLALAAVIAAALSGCSRTPDYVGSYSRVDTPDYLAFRARAKAAGADRPFATSSLGQDHWVSLDSFLTADLTLAPDGTWVLRNAGGERRESGTWTAAGDTLHLADAVPAASSGPGRTFIFDPATQTLTAQVKEAAGFTYVFKKH
jgi:hypothetical protein